MSIRNISVKDGWYQPGEHLGGAESYTHIIISYDVCISDGRHKVDTLINDAIENDPRLIKVENVNTTLYWQTCIESKEKEELETEINKVLKEKLKEIFFNDSEPLGATINVFCLVGNIRCFAFEINI